MAKEEALLEAVGGGEVERVRELLERGVDVDAQGPGGNAALHLAVQNGDTKIARLLLEGDGDVNIQNNFGETALLLAARSGDLASVKLLLKFGADKRIKDANGRTPFFVAMSASHSEVAAELLPGERGGSEKSSNAEGSFFGQTAAAGNETSTGGAEKRLEVSKRADEQHLRDAAEAGDIVGVMEILTLSPGIDLNALDDQRHTAVYRAVFYGRTQVVEFLLKEGADVDIPDTNGKTPLHVAASQGFGKITRVLLEYTKNVNVHDLFGATPLFSAAESGSTDVLRALVEGDADLNIPNNNEETPLWAAAAKGHAGFVKLLLEEGFRDGKKIEVDSPGVEEGKTPLHLAAERGDIRIARLLLERGASKDLRDGSGCTALFIAADMGRTRMVAFLLENGVFVDAVNHHGETALYVSALDGHVPVTQELLAHGADTEAADVNGQTPLMGAAQEGHTAIISELLKSSARIESANNIGESPLMIASLEGFQNAVALLIANGADFDTARNDGKTALHMSAMDGHVGVMNVLLSAAQSNFKEMKTDDASKASFLAAPLHLATDTQGETALHLAARFGQVSAMQMLLDYDTYFREQLKGSTFFGRLVDVQNKFGWTALHGSVDGAHRGAVALLLNHTANVNAADVFGNTPMHLAARGVDHRILFDLLSTKGSRSGAVNVEGRTPLHFASACMRPSCVTFLLNGGADALAADVYKKLPMDVLGSVNVCNPRQALDEGLCDIDARRPDMCPITLGSKNELFETEVLLQIAAKNQNQTKPCLDPCTDTFTPGTRFTGERSLPTNGSTTSSRSPSVNVPIFGVLIPLFGILLLIGLGVCCFVWRKQSRKGKDTSQGRCSSRLSSRRMKQKQNQAELDRTESAMDHQSAVNRKATFDVLRSILAEPRNDQKDTKASETSFSDSETSCGWSDASEDEETKRQNELGGCSSGEQPSEWGGRCIQAPRGLGEGRRPNTNAVSEVVVDCVPEWSPPLRLGSVPRMKPKECQRNSFIIRLTEETKERNESESEPFPSPERVSSTPIF